MGSATESNGDLPRRRCLDRPALKRVDHREALCPRAPPRTVRTQNQISQAMPAPSTNGPPPIPAVSSTTARISSVLGDREASG